MNSTPRTLLLTIALALVSFPAWSYPTSLNVVPTDKTLAKGKLSLEVQSDSHDLPFDPRSTDALYLQAGLTNRLEFGVDTYSVESKGIVQVNAKYAVLKETKGLPGLALGIWGCRYHQPSEFYLAGGRTLGPLFLTLGAAANDGHVRAMGGGSYSFGQFTAMADHQTGYNGQTSLGLSYAVNGGPNIGFYYSRANARGTNGSYTGLNFSTAVNLFR